MTSTRTALDADWLAPAGARWRGLERAAGRDAERPRERARRDRHPRQRRRPHAGDRPGGRGAWSFAELERLARPRATASPRSPRSAARSTSATARVRVIIDPIDGSLNAKRGACHYALSIAVADGDDDGRRRVRLRARLRRRARSGGRAAARARGSTASRLDPALGERRVARRPARAASGSSPPTRAGWRPRSTALAELAPTGCGRWARSPATLCQVAAARFDGMVTLRALPRRRRRRRAADRARGRRPGQLHRLRRPARRRRWTPTPRSPWSPRARPRRCAELESGSPDRDRLDPRREDRRLRRRHRRRARPRTADLAALAAESERRVTAYTGLRARRGRCRRPRASAAREWVATNIARDARAARPGARARRRGPRAAAAGRCSSTLGLVRHAPRSAVVLGYLAQRVLGQYELVLLDEARRRAPAAAAVRAAQPRRRRCSAFGADERGVHDLGDAARGHPRGPVRRRAVAARPRRRARARAAATSAELRIDADAQAAAAHAARSCARVGRRRCATAT